MSTTVSHISKRIRFLSALLRGRIIMVILFFFPLKRSLDGSVPLDYWEVLIQS